MGNICCAKRKVERKIVLLLVGLDNAGKTVAAKGLAGEPVNTVVPTVGFSVTNLSYLDYKVKVFDLGGGSDIRGIWSRYFVDAHGIIFVVDSSDYSRLDEAKDVLQNLISSEKISGKPVLILANKQDQQDALDELDLVEKLQLESLVNRKHCPTLVESCCATEISSKSKLDEGIRKGYKWLLNYIVRDYECLNSRVEADVIQQEILDKQIRLEKMERLKASSEKNNTRDEDIVELYSEYASKCNGRITEISSNGNDVTVSQRKKTSNSNSEFSSQSEEDPLPHIYHGNLMEEMSRERPKSATQIVKEQLELEHIQRKSFRKLIPNKTVPANLYEPVKYTQSAFGKREVHTADPRSLKSAGDAVITQISSPSVLTQKKNDFDQELFHLNNFDAPKGKLPPLNIANEIYKIQNGLPLSHKTNKKFDISVIDID